MRKNNLGVEGTVQGMIGTLIVVVVIIVVIFILIALIKVRGSCFCQAFDGVCKGICDALVECFENLDCEVCLKYICCVCSSPCLFFNWLHRKLKHQQNQEPQITDTTVVTDLLVEGREHPIQQTNINISIHNEPRHRSGSVSNSSDDFELRDPPTRYPVDGSVPPPSYHEETNYDPPSYFEATNYPPSYSVALNYHATEH